MHETNTLHSFLLLLGDRRQITFVTLDGFCPLSNSPLPPHPPSLSLTDNVKLIKYQPKLDEESTSVSHCISSFQDAPYKKLEDATTSSIICYCFTSSSAFRFNYTQQFLLQPCWDGPVAGTMLEYYILDMRREL